MASSANSHNLRGDGVGAAATGGGLVSSPPPPPPTPSNQSLARSLSSDTDAALSRFLHQLLLSPTSLSTFPPPPLRRRSSLSSSFSSSPPLLSLPQLRLDLLPLRSAAFDLGFFHLAGHGDAAGVQAALLAEARSFISNHHPASAENLSSLGFGNHDEFADSGEKDRILALETDGKRGGEELESLPSLKKYAESLERVSMELMEMLTSMEGGFYENPFSKGSIYKRKYLLWISESKSTRKIFEEEEERDTEMRKSKCYPFILGFHLMQEANYKQQPWCVLGDSGEWNSVEPSAWGGGNRLLVTLGDIAQVWSNGRLRKVNGRPRPSVWSLDSCVDDGSSLISVSFFVTLPLDSVISPILPSAVDPSRHFSNQIVDEINGDGEDEDIGKFRAFGLEEYAWRLYHERLPNKDPLLKYRI